MKILSSLSALTLVLACSSGSAIAADVVPSEVMKAIDAVNQAAQDTGKVVSATAEKASNAIESAGNKVADAVDSVKSGSNVSWVDDHVLAVGLGAIGGVIVFNLATGGMAAVPMLASATGGTVVESTVAVSRVYAVSSAVVGGLVGDYSYRRMHSGGVAAIPGNVIQRITPGS